MAEEASRHISQRQAMVADQLRRRGICDSKVLSVMGGLGRHLFIPERYRGEAYSDNPVSIGHGQTISQPYIVALMTQSLELQEDHRVLEIGTGCGYQTAILAQLVREVYTIERIAELGEFGQKNVSGLGLDNVHYRVADGTQGWPGSVVFDRILIAAAAGGVSQALLNQLVDGGRIVAPLGNDVSQRLVLLEKQGKTVSETVLCYCRFVKLISDDPTGHHARGD